jgi:hypothetical protein
MDGKSLQGEVVKTIDVMLENPCSSYFCHEKLMFKSGRNLLENFCCCCYQFGHHNPFEYVAREEEAESEEAYDLSEWNWQQGGGLQHVHA